MAEIRTHSSARQTPLGKLLKDAREQRGLSLAQVAEAVGININSLSKYEKAGLAETGQYPPANKLAVLWSYLDLNPLSVLLGCISKEEYGEAEAKIWDHFVVGHPLLQAIEANAIYMEKQYSKLLQDVAFLKNFVRVWLAETGGDVDISSFADWMRQQAFETVQHYDGFDRNLMVAGLVLPQDAQHPLPLYRLRERLDEIDVTQIREAEVDPNMVKLWKEHLQTMLRLVEEAEQSVPSVESGD